MDSSKTGELITQLTVGFDALQEEYRDLHGKYSGLERKLHTAREQVSHQSCWQEEAGGYGLCTSVMMSKNLALDL